jgi:integrase
MQSIYECVTLECQNEHDLEHDLEHKTKFSTPKIFDAGGDLSKRWYVYFSYRNPKTGKLKRMKNIYGSANRYKAKEARYTILNLYKKRLFKFLNEGYNPFEDNTELHIKKLSKQSQNGINQNLIKIDTNSLVNRSTNSRQELEDSITVKEAFDKAIELKTNVINERTLTDYQNRIHLLENWLKDNHNTIKFISQVTKKLIVQFLNEVQLKTSSRNRNNYRTVFSSIFQILEDNEIIDKNFILQIKPIKTQPKRNKTYSNKEQKTIFNYLETNDRLLLLYIKFVSYSFLRPIEVCRLRVKDINFEQRTLQFQAKNKALKTKIIPEILFKELPDLSSINGELLLFTPNAIGGKWGSMLANRRDYFSKRFKKVVKNHFGFNENYGLYSFRHTFITKLYRALTKDSSPYEAKSRLMQITGHSTMTALEKYLRDIDAELPEDYSNLL